MKEFTDTKLVQHSLDGDKKAFSLLVARHGRRLQRTLRPLLPSAADVEDVWQETFLQAYLSLDRLQDPSRFRAWVCGIGLNLARMWLRGMPKGLVSLQTLGQLDLGHHNRLRLPEQHSERQEKARLLAAAMADLPPSEREALLLVYWDGFSHRETAVQLGTSTGAIKVRTHRGRQHLKKLLQFEQTDSDILKETQMVNVEVFDVIRCVNHPDYNIDLEEILSPLLDNLPQESRAEMVQRSHLTMNFPLMLVELMEAADSEQQEALLEQIGLLRIKQVVLLKEAEGDRILPIWIGPYEADLIGIQLQHLNMKRPLLPDLTQALLEISGTKVRSASVSKLHQKIYYGELNIEVGAAEKTVDCRSSDAIVMAVRLNVPIFVAEEVMAAEGRPLSTLNPVKPGAYSWTTNEIEYQWLSML